MKIQELMTRDVRTCGPRDSLNRAAQLMWEGDCGCVVVVDDRGRAIGTVTDRDVCMAAYTQGAPIDRIPVSTAASRAVWSARPEDDLSVAERVMREHQVQRVPIVDDDGRPIGMLSLHDLVRHSGRGRPDSLSSDIVMHTLATVHRRVDRHSK